MGLGACMGVLRFQFLLGLAWLGWLGSIAVPRDPSLSLSRSLCVFGNGSALESGSPENNEDTVAYECSHSLSLT